MTGLPGGRKLGLDGREESKCLQLDEGFQVQELIHCNPKITT